jgi:hypothetical protein
MILKVLPDYRSACTNEQIAIPAITNYFVMIGVDNVRKIYPNHKVPATAKNKWGAPMIDLTLIYEVHFTSALQLDNAIGKLFNLGYFEYVEPHYIPKICMIPNDPKSANNQSGNGQYHIYTVHAAGSTQSGWDISTGSTSTTIGIVDTGTELTHTDLMNQIQHNLADPIDGSDNDGDGYVDNYNGWDLGSSTAGDNDPTWQGNAHGVAVCGDADEQCNNNIGGCGTGYNCRFLPVKIADASGALVASYEGITYAADHGCSVINCSWGGVGGGSYGQGIIDYATNNKDALVVCAAGNNGIDEAFYPAAYDKVLSVAATDAADAHASFTDYNYTVDICSPGVNVNATWTSNSYTMNSGTSMASPVCAGCAAIVRSYYPAYNAMQTYERLKQTADNIYVLPSNSSATYTDKLGAGRVNLYRALTDPTTPAIIYDNVAYTDNNDNAFVANDTVRITGNYNNYLAPTTNLIATLSVVSGGTYVTLVDNSHTVGVLGTLGVANQNADPFQVKILPSAPVNQQIVFKLTMTDGTYSVNQYFSMIVNVDYINVTVNDVWTTITSKGLIGYNQPNQLQGLGFAYMPFSSGTLVYESSFMVGSGATKVSDMVRNGTPGNTDADFSSVYAVRQVPNVVSDFDLDGKHRDNVAVSPLPVTVHQRSYAWSQAPHRKYVIVQYTIQNTSASTLSTVYAGIFADWDIDASTYGVNKVDFDAANRMGYAYCTNAGGKYCGIELLTTSAPVVHYGIDNVSGGAGGVNIYDGYTDGEKYTTLSTNRQQAGVTGNGNDICDVTSSGPFTIAAGDSVTVAFALIAGDDLTDLQASAVDAQYMYSTYGPLAATFTQSPNAFGFNAYPNPTSGMTDIHYNLAEEANTEIRLIDASGQLVAILDKGDKSAGEYYAHFNAATLSEGMYFIQLITNGNVVTRKMVITH